MHDGQHAAHHLGVSRKQVAQREWDAQHPLPDRPPGQDLVNQVRSTVCHAPGATGGAESTAFATKSHKLLIVTGLTSNTQEAVLKTTTLQVIPELPDDIPGQDLTLRRQHVLEMRPVLLDQLVKQRVLWLMSLILKWANGPEVVLECIGWQDQASLCDCDKHSYSSTAIAISAFTA